MSAAVVAFSILPGMSVSMLQIVWGVAKMVVSVISGVVGNGGEGKLPCSECEARRLIKNQHSAMYIKFEEDGEESDGAVIVRRIGQKPVHL